MARVMVMPNSRFDSCTINRISHCRPLIVKMPPCVSEVAGSLMVLDGSCPVPHVYPVFGPAANLGGSRAIFREN